MVTKTLSRGWIVLLVLFLVQLACGSSSSPAETPIQPAAVSPTQVPQPSPTTAVVEADVAIRQWASEAEASSEYGDSDWAAYQAAGAPDTPDCGDMKTAWAAANQNTIEWINVYFATPVYAAQINIVETYYPDQVTQVDLIDMEGKYVTIYMAPPQMVESPCPYTLTVAADEKTLVQGVRITIDQSVIGNWNEIDAVEIVGVPGEGIPVRPPVEP